MKYNLKDKTNINIKIIGISFVKVFIRSVKKIRIHIFFVVLLGFIAIGSYIWWKNIYSGEWSSEKKQEYMNIQNKKIMLNEKDLNNVIDDISLREDEFLREYQPVKDIFKAY
ncbi:MAG TPA: hypothetical protein P5548_01880 [Candidatus Moranbacteria bacterium]|nr:hypothetical protein [Candidatus Moranbacteria bacterium]HRZ33629.1 hypothetical protein [Candidatus Moranbacteria bacterium]